MKRALTLAGRAAAVTTLAVGALALSGCDEAILISTSELGAPGSGSASATVSGESTISTSALARARPVEIDVTKYGMVVPVVGDDFLHILFKSPIHAQEAGYCLSSGYGPVTKVLQGVDPQTRQSFYFIECEKTDPAAASIADRIAALEAEQSQHDARSAEMQAAADAAVEAAGAYVDPYADCPVGEGGYPIVTDDCGPQ